MKAKFLVISCGILALASACNNSSESKAKETDTANAMTTDTSTAMPKDSAAPGPLGSRPGEEKNKKGSAPQTQKAGHK